MSSILRTSLICVILVGIAAGIYFWVQSQDVQPELMNSTAEGNPPVAGAVGEAGR